MHVSHAHCMSLITPPGWAELQALPMGLHVQVLSVLVTYMLCLLQYVCFYMCHFSVSTMQHMHKACMHLVTTPTCTAYVISM